MSDTTLAPNHRSYNLRWGHALLGALWGGLALAPAARAAPLTPVTPSCLVTAAAEARVPLLAVLGILTVERGQVGQASPDQNGTYDYGPMQINSVWLPILASRFHLSRWAIQDSGCLNVAVGAWILSHDWRTLGAGASIWQAIAQYHSTTAALADPYAWRVYNNLRRGVRVQHLIRVINGE